MYRDKFISVVITAAGNGLRMGLDLPKLEYKIKDKHIIDYTVDVFKDCSFIDEIILVTSKKLFNQYSNRYVDSKIKVVKGGSSREESTYNGLQNISEDSDYVICHDGARPAVTEDLIIKVLDKGIETGAAIPGVPSVDTVKVIKNNKVIKTPKRSTLYNIQTPQVFETDLIKSAYDKYLDCVQITDDSSLIELIGHEVTLVKGEYSNIKITTIEDLERIVL